MRQLAHSSCSWKSMRGLTRGFRQNCLRFSAVDESERLRYVRMSSLSKTRFPVNTAPPSKKRWSPATKEISVRVYYVRG